MGRSVRPLPVPSRGWVRAAPVALVMLGLAGCVTSGGMVAPPPPHLSPSGETAPPGDARPPTSPAPPHRPSGSLTLDDVIRTCLAADPKIRAGFEDIAQAQADYVTSSLKPNPQLYTDIQLLPLQNWTPERTGGPPQFDFQLSYPIDWWLFGKRAAAMAAADKGVLVSHAEVADLIRTRVTEAAVTFYDVLEAKELVEVARQDLENLLRVEASLQKAVAAGGRPQVELNRIRLDVLKSRQALREAVAAQAKAIAQLRALLGRADADPVFDVTGSLDVADPVEPPSADEAFGLAQENRPDLQALRGKVARAEADVRVEDTKAKPAVKPTAGYTHQFQRRPIGQPDADSYTLALEMDVPWHDKNQGNRLKARSVLAQSHHELQLGLVDLRAEIEQTLTDVRLSASNVRSVAGEQLKLARDVRDSITAAYNAGGRTLLDFLDAQRNFRETYRLYITSRAGYWRSVVRLNAAIGKQVLHHVPCQLPIRR